MTLFRALPPSAQAEVRRSLARTASQPAPAASIAGVMDMDGGVAFRVASDELERIRDDLAGEFHGLLSAQDRGPWTPHVTIQNKVDPRDAAGLVRQMRAGFEPRPLGITGLHLVRYVGGDWEPLASWRFR